VLNILSWESIELGKIDGKSVFYSYVPIIKSLEISLKKHKIKRDVNSLENVYSNYSDSAYYKRKNFFMDNDVKLELIIYSDDFNLADPLGAAKTKYKTNGVYYKLANIVENLHLKKNIKLIQLCKTEDINNFGYNKLFKRLVDDIKYLESTGISVRIDGQLKNILGSILFFSSDNLGAHTIIGLPQNFSTSSYIC
jgi:hypothetical protein